MFVNHSGVMIFQIFDMLWKSQKLKFVSNLSAFVLRYEASGQKRALHYWKIWKIPLEIRGIFLLKVLFWRAGKSTYKLWPLEKWFSVETFNNEGWIFLIIYLMAWKNENIFSIQWAELTSASENLSYYLFSLPTS